jgi:hypothetical protein
MRATLSLGAGWRYRVGRLALGMHAEALAALLWIGGAGYDITRSSFDFDPGLGAGARLGIRLGRVTPFIDASVAGWLRSHLVQVSGAPERVELPRFEVLLTAGVGFGNLR